MTQGQVDKIATALEDMVVSGQLRDGEHLDEASLADRFGVSRTPVRAALQRLVSAQLAHRLPRRGVFVHAHSSTRLIELYETMAEVEGMCCRIAAARCSADKLDLLDGINDRCRQAMSSKDFAAYSRHNVAFHGMIYSATGNRFLEREATRLFDLLRPFRRAQFRLPGRMQASCAEHDRIIAALRSRDGAAAARAARDHIGSQDETYFEKIAYRGAGTPRVALSGRRAVSQV